MRNLPFRFSHRLGGVTPLTAALGVLLIGALSPACDGGAFTDDPVDPGNPEDNVPAVVDLDQTQLELTVGESAQLYATVYDQAGDPLEANVAWSSSEPAVAGVNESGVVTAWADGTTSITAKAGEVTASAAVTVHEETSPVPPPGDDDDPEWDNVLSDVTIEEDVVVPAGEKWLIGPNVQIAGNLRTEGGTIAMRPGSSLKFLGANPDEYVGGGLYWEPRFENDIGLWVHNGVLDIRCTPKVGWNRTGTHETWEADDEYWIAPTEIGDYSPRRWYPGDPIPQADPRVPPAEVINVTRDCVIEGPGHIHIHSNQPQRIEYVQLRRLGVSNVASDGPVVGRYALHLHFSGNGTRGTIIRGVAAVNSEGRVFVPHESHGVTMLDNVSVHSWAGVVWWDPGDSTDDLLIDGLAVSGVEGFPREIRPSGGGSSAITHASGYKPTIRNAVVSGVFGDAYLWSNNHQSGEHGATWIFEDNVAHNNTGTGIFFWLNCCLDKRPQDHHPKRAIVYRNGGPDRRGEGIENGAYRNAHRYTDVLVVDNSIIQHSSSEAHSYDGGPARYTRLEVFAREGAALTTGQLQAGGNGSRIEFIDCKLVPAPGSPAVLVRTASNPFLALFRRCGLTPDDIMFDGAPEETSIIIEHEDGRKWEVRQDGGQKVVIELN